MSTRAEIGWTVLVVLTLMIAFFVWCCLALGAQADAAWKKLREGEKP
jgi:hypothetical protein